MDAISTESIGVNVPPKCSTCKSVTADCKECQLLTQTTSYLESVEDKLIQDSIEYLPEEKRYIASYPYTSEINNLLSNKEIAFRRALNLEANLKKNPEELKSVNEILYLYMLLLFI